MNEDILLALRERVGEYAKEASLARNAHMNRWRGPDPSVDETTAFITTYLSGVQDFPARSFDSFYNHLLSAAKATNPDDELKKAMLVDYINWAAFRFFCADLGLYTCDL